jgi:hypothetical protein
MGRMVVLVVASALCLGACGGDEDDAADTSGASTTARRGEPIVIRGELIVAATAGSEPTATGTILPGSILGGSTFCAGGTIRDSHASLDPKMKPYLIDRKITCTNGTVRIGITPEVSAAPQPQTQTGSWTIVSGTGVFERLAGSGKAKLCTAPTPIRRYRRH